MNFLLLNHQLKLFTGSEINLLQLCRALRGMGHTVTIGTLRCGSPMIDLIKAEAIPVVDLLSGNPQRMDFDVIWAHHAPVLTQLIFKYPLADAKILFSSLGPLEPLESAPLFHEALPYFLVNSAGNRQQMLAHGVAGEKIHYFPNYAPSGFFSQCRNSLPERPGRIAVISNHPINELREFSHIASRSAIQVDFIGQDDRSVYVDEALLTGYDLVISIGKTVQYCFSLKVPIYIYDHFGGPGYLNAQNFAQAEHYNFSGRGFNRSRTAEALYQDVIEGYSSARDGIENYYQIGRERFCLETNLNQILANLDQLAPTHIADIRPKYPLVERFNDLYVRELSQRWCLEKDLEQRDIQIAATKESLQSIHQSRGWSFFQRLRLIYARLRQQWKRLSH